MIGKTLGHYRIVEKIGAGGMGEVYRAHDEQLDRDVALKILPPGTLVDDAARKRFRKEALALAKLNHPNIETVFEFGSQDGGDFLAMELIAGVTLSSKLAEGPLPEKETLRLGTQLAEGLAAAHAQGIVHRDLKPGNLMITSEGRLKILDFGLATLLHPSGDPDMTRSVTETTSVSGTLPYMSPEQLRGQAVDARSDIYAAGAVLYEMATGRRPFLQRQGAELIGAILHETPPPPSSVNHRVRPALEGMILKALEKEPGRRYQSAREILVALEGVETGRMKPLARWPWPILYRWAALAVVIGLAVGGWLYYARRAHGLSETDTIVLADFFNSTGDAVFDDTLRQGLAVELEQSPFLNMISEQKIQQTLQMMGKKPDAKLTPEVAREICQRTNSTAVLDGSIGRVGTQYLLTLEAVNCATGEALAGAKATANDENHVLEALGKVSTGIRNKLGESLRTVRRFDTPLEQATTPSLEALKAFSTGIKVINTTGSQVAIPFFEHAVELDPKFALAYAYLGIMENDLLETSKAVEYQAKAYEFRERASEVEKYSITATYQKEVTGNIERAIDACQLWLQSYPRAFHPHDLLAGMMLPAIGQHERAIGEASEAIRLNPDFPIAYVQRILSLTALNRLDEAEATYAQALQRKLNNPLLDIALYHIAFLRNDAAAMAQQVARTKYLPGFEDQLLNLEADTAAYSGRLRDARDLSRRAIDSAKAAGEKDAPLIYSVTSGLREAWFGNADEAGRRVTPALSGSPTRDVLYLAALAFAYSREDGRAQKLADDLKKKFPEDTLVWFNFLPTLRAKIALDRGNPPEAIEDLRVAAPYELGLSTQSPFNWTAMYPVYVRGEAYLAAHQGSQATTEFQKILDHRGLVLNQPTGPLARLGLARASVLQGDTARARAAYNDFLALWKDADPDIPILKQAKAEYAKLK